MGKSIHPPASNLRSDGLCICSKVSVWVVRGRGNVNNIVRSSRVEGISKQTRTHANIQLPEDSRT